MVDTDASTDWTPEGNPIDVSQPVLPEVEAVLKGLKGLVVTSNELWDDADASAPVLDVVGNGLVRDLQTRLDAAYFGTTTANRPSGLGSLSDTQENDLSWDETLDVFADALSKAEQTGVAAVGADGAPNMTFILSPSDTLRVMTTKVAVDSAAPLLGPDATQATGRNGRAQEHKESDQDSPQKPGPGTRQDRRLEPHTLTAARSSTHRLGVPTPLEPVAGSRPTATRQHSTARRVAALHLAHTKSVVAHDIR